MYCIDYAEAQGQSAITQVFLKSTDLFWGLSQAAAEKRIGRGAGIGSAARAAHAVLSTYHALCIVHCALYIVHCALCSLYYLAQCAVYCVQ